MLYTLPPSALVDIPIVFSIGLHYSLPNSSLLALSHGTHQNARGVPQPGRTANPPRGAMHRQRQTGPETPLSRDHKKLQACSRALERVS